ncbi:TPA: DUF2586 family protein [Klebsiella michiganensis]|nr:DUF2586 family protein [Klebsiella michiganensis]
MTWPNVTINQINQRQGDIADVERTLLFAGPALPAMPADAPPLIAVNAQSDIDSELRYASDLLRENVAAAQLNGGQNWQAYVALADADIAAATAAEANSLWTSLIETALATVAVEGVVILGSPADSRSLISALHDLRASIISNLGRWVWFIVALGAPAAGTDWSAYVTKTKATLNGLAAYSVTVVPLLWGPDAGVLAGRLCNRSVTIADSPARVMTGELLGMGADLPVDGKGAEITLAWLRALHDIRCSVPMWYPDYEGLYWSDGLTLEVTGGDFQVIEHLRIMDKVARRVRVRAISRIANRSLNTLPSSIEAHKTFFGRELREMSRSVQLSGVTFPGEIEKPKEGDITIVWLSKKSVVIGATARPYACAKEITVNIALDNELEE